MYEFIKMVIIDHAYTDLNTMAGKINKAWAMSAITDAEHAELIAMLRAKQPCFDMDVQAEITKLWAAIKALQTRPASEAEPEVEPEGIPEWVQPSGAHDAYNIGDRVRYNGTIYDSLINGNAYSPDVYPAGWKEVE